MTGDAALETVYRSADMNAEQDAGAIKNLLMSHGIDALLCDDNSPGVLEGTYEVRVPPAQLHEAESIISTVNQEDPGRADPTHELDMVTFRITEGTTAEMEALAIQGILDASGIAAIVMGNSTLPNLAFYVKVAKADAERATQVIAEAEEAGPAAACEAALESERNAEPQV
jgi:hypothetical protein